jgi:hypothetical protein
MFLHNGVSRIFKKLVNSIGNDLGNKTLLLCSKSIV